MLTKGSWIKIAAVALLAIALCAGMFSCSLGFTPLMRGCVGIPGAAIGALADYENVGNGSVDAGQVRGIELDWAAGRVVFEQYDVAYGDGGDGDDRIVLEEDAGRPLDDGWKMRWEVSGGVLRIAYCASGGGLAGCTPLNWPDKTLSIAIPKSAADHLESVAIDGLSGEYSLDGLRCETLDLNLASGRVHGTDAGFGDMRVEMASGNVSLVAQVQDGLSVKVASGDFDLTCPEAMPRTSTFELASGNVGVSVPSDSGFTATVDKMSGNFACDFPDMHRVDDAYVHGDGSASVSVDMASGNVTLRGHDA